MLIEEVKRGPLKANTLDKPIKIRYNHMIEDAVGVNQFGAEIGSRWKLWRSLSSQSSFRSPVISLAVV